MTSSSNICPKCNTENRPGARFCLSCGETLIAARPEQGSPPSKWSVAYRQMLEEGQMFSQEIGRLAKNVPRLLFGSPPKQPAQRKHNKIASPLAPGEKIFYFYVLETFVTPGAPHIRYYRVRSTRCLNCEKRELDSYEQCPHCNAVLPTYILRQAPIHGQLTDEDRQNIFTLSESISGVLPHLLVFDVDQQRYIVLAEPQGKWQGLATIVLPLPLELAVAYCLSISQTAAQLHERGYAMFNEPANESILVVNSQIACLADLTQCRALDKQMDKAASFIQRDLRTVTHLLFTWSTGQNGHTRPLGAPPPVQNVIDNSNNGNYATMADLINAIRQIPVMAPPPTRSLRQLVGYTTNVGQVREANEDFVGKYSFAMEQKPGAPELGLYIVADGMGGHAAGERASKDIVRVILDRIHQLMAAPKLKGVTLKLSQAVTASEILEEAILQANKLLFEARQAARSDRGTTLTAAVILGDAATIANVGDSRTYLMRENVLQQITHDHSLVASLAAAGMIKHEEIRSHPQRNQIYRTLGDKPKVDVDIFPQILAAGDILLLCSDGLWEMVEDQKIQAILASASSPQAACDELIRAANAHGGEDNISAIVIKIE